ncbi:MAG TPA: hypothetical protein VGP92_08140 [Acidimicrobiia bacterium]|nr:hypothetical protein [Acidimicrobiia bacterium]
MSISRSEQEADDAREVAARSSITSGLLLTVGAWLAARVVVGVAHGPTRNPFAARPANWARWDSFNYFKIAVHGRTFGRCDSAQFAAAPNPLHTTWCGTAGWLPGYPWLIRALQPTGLDVTHAAVAISWFAIATALFLVWYGWCRDLSRARAFAVLLLFGLFPGAVYNFAVFPTSLALAFVVGALIAAVRERYLLGAVLLTGAGLCYPSAWFAAIGVAVVLVALGSPFGVGEVLRRACYGFLGLASLFGLVLVDRPWNALFLMDGQRGLRAPGFPGQDFLRLVFTHSTVEQRILGDWTAWVLAAQGLLAVGIAGAVGVLAVVAWRRHGQDVMLLYPAAVGVAVVLGVLALNANGGAWNRSVVLAAPTVVGLRRLPLAYLYVIVAAVGITAVVLSSTFFDGRLV